MLRATSGIGVSVRDTWLGTVPPAPVQDTCISMATGVCSTHYRNSRIDVWSALSISEVTIELYKSGSRVAFVTFNGTHSDRESWMSPSRVLSSIWKSLTPDRQYLIFSLEGEAPCSRVFFILNNLGGCPSDAGWFTVLDPRSSGCCPASWDDLINKPRFLYSTLDDLATFQSSDVDFADVMAIFIKKNS
ncbi:uncharacterized protein LOC134250389 [Saccostrea cucullata]|uniref:uncharacterized protein LOC134250389 n=1 Tax=Saccostrea cuccullata TaxID=36930 RepID=UPI002ED6548B